MKEHMYASGGGTLQNKKGFTLIELLAVIVILAIIALIATPIVLDIINDSRENAAKQSVESLVRAAELYHASNAVNKEYKKFISLPDKRNILNIENAEEMEGYISISEKGEIELLAEINGIKYAKNYNSDKIYNVEKDNYIYDGNPDEWIVSSNNPNRLIGWVPKFSKYGISPMYEAMTIPIYFYNLSKEDFRKELAYSISSSTFNTVITKGKTLDDTIKAYEDMFYGYKYYLPKVYVNELEIIIQKLKEEYGNTITDDTLISTETLSSYIETIKDQVPIYYSFITQTNIDNLEEIILSMPEDVIPGKVNGNIIKEIAAYPEVGIDCDTQDQCHELYGEIPGYIKYSGYNSTSIKISEGIEVIGHNYFYQSVVYKVSLPSTLKTIEDLAFYDNEIEELIIPKSVVSIGEKAFFSNPITEIVIPASVETIGHNAFKTSTLTKVTIEGDATRFNDVWTDIGFPAELMPTE